MFHLYFGAFDLILYVAAFFVAMSVSRTLCDTMDAVTPLDLAAVTETPQTDTPVSTSTDQAIRQQPTTMAVNTRVASNQTTSSLKDTDDKTNEKPVLKLSEIRLYKLRKQSVVRLSDVPFPVPAIVQRYRLSKKAVVKLKDLENIAKVVS